MEFLNLLPTFGVENITYDMLDFFSVDFAEDFGLKNLDPVSLATFRKDLENEDDVLKTLKFFISKLGFDPEDITQYNQGLAVLLDEDLVTESDLKFGIGKALCLMHKSSDDQEYKDCCNDVNSTEFAQFLQ